MPNLIEYRAALRAEKYPSTFRVYAKEVCRFLGCGIVAYMIGVWLVVLMGK